MPILTVAAIAEALAVPFSGNGEIAIGRASEPSAAGPRDLALAMDKTYLGALGRGSARAAVLWPGADWRALGLEAAIFVDRPRYAMAGITAAFDRGPEVAPGIHETAIVDPTATIGPGAAIGPFVTIGARTKIGARACILGQVSIASDVAIGDDALLHEGVRIGSGAVLGDRFRAQHNASVGADGFSYVTPEPHASEEARRHFEARSANRDQKWHRIASTASVRIGDDVEIGASSTIDKGTVADTVVGRGTKIDNHAHVGHNARLGEDCLMCGHTGVSGSSVLGDRVVLGGQSGVGDHLTIGNDVIAAGATAILSNVPAGRVMMGYPAMQMKKNIEAYKALRRLPRLIARLDALEARIAALAAGSGSGGGE